MISRLPIGHMVVLFILTGPVVTTHGQTLGLDPTARDVETLVAIDDLHLLANDGARLLSWSVFSEFLGALPQARRPGEVLPKKTIAKLTEVTIEIVETDWDVFDRAVIGITGLKRITLLKAASLCRERVSSHRKNAAAKQFWTALGERYANQAKRLPR